MDIDLIPWLNLAVRWLHLVAGIAWIGSSFYFVWLDNHLRPPRHAKAGVQGELWSVHGGGFYHQQKYPVAPADMPEELHWFKWEAYWTWISGFFLLGIVYYLGADVYLIDTAKADLGRAGAIALGLAVLAGGWLAYDGLSRSPLGRQSLLFGALWFGALTALAFALQQIFSDRGAFVHVGAVIGTAMVGNVFFVIIPNQKKVVADLTAGRDPDPALGRQAKQRSVHNNYMTLPVLFIMISNHYPMTYGHSLGWLSLAGLALSGVLIRHFFNLRHFGHHRPAYPAAGVAVFLAVMGVSSWSSGRALPDLGAAGETRFAQVQTIVTTHCTTCHAAQPSHRWFDAPPGGVVLTDRAAIERYAPQIYAQAVASNVMPMGNETGMTIAERQTLGAWLAANTDGVSAP